MEREGDLDPGMVSIGGESLSLKELICTDVNYQACSNLFGW